MATLLRCPRCAGEFQADRQAIGAMPCPDCGVPLEAPLTLAGRLRAAFSNRPGMILDAGGSALLVLLLAVAAFQLRAGSQEDEPNAANQPDTQFVQSDEQPKAKSKPAVALSRATLPSPEEQRAAVMKQLREETWPNPYEAVKLHSPVMAWQGEVLCDGGADEMVINRQDGYLYFVSRGSADAARRDGRIQRVPLEGGKREILVEGDLSQPGGLALDIEGGKMYWFCTNWPKAGRIQRANLDGTDVEDVIVGVKGRSQMAFDPGSRQLFWEDRGKLMCLEVEAVGEHQRADPRGNAARARELVTSNDRDSSNNIWCVSIDEPSQSLLLGVGRPKRGVLLSLDGSSVQDIECEGDQWQLLRDPVHGAYYWRGVDGLRRSRPDGSRREHWLRGKMGVFYTIDWENRQLYGVVTYNRRTTVNRIEISPEPETVLLPAPPKVERLEPIAAKTGETLRIFGEHFTEAQAVTFIDDSTGERVFADFKLISDAEIEATVPKLRSTCKEAVVTVQTQGGVTFTLDEEASIFVAESGSISPIRPTTPISDDKPYSFAKVLYTLPGERRTVSRIDTSVVFALPWTNASLGPRGGNVVFARNDTQINSFLSSTNVIYHEPFVDRPNQSTDDNEYIAVPAIRASIVDRLFEYVTE